MTIKNILDIKDTVKKLLNVHFTSFKVVRNLTKTVKRFDEEIDIYTSQLQKLIDDYAEKDENGNIVTSEKGDVKIKKEFIGDFNKAYSEMLNVEVFEDFEKIDISEKDFLYSKDLPTVSEMLVLSSIINWID